MKKFIISTAAIVFAGTASIANAGGQFIDYAEVIDVQPIVRYVTVTTPRQECWVEDVVHQARPKRNVGGMVLGGLIGGAVGNQFGRGQGKKASIAVGTLLGAGIGQNLADQNRGGSNQYVTQERRCQTIQDSYQEERIDGYRVKYSYNGAIYHTRTQTDPGKQLAVKVTVTAAQ